METIKRIPLFWKIIIVLDIIAALGIVWFLYIYPNTPVSAAPMPAFSHENCQYPDRATNPPDGCDNSDPACPELIKGATTCPADEYKDPTPPNPDRDYYDQYGNRYTWDGKLKEAAPQPEGGQASGKCTK
jgi:hypothetical protein